MSQNSLCNKQQKKKCCLFKLLCIFCVFFGEKEREKRQDFALRSQSLSLFSVTLLREKHCNTQKNLKGGLK